MKLQSLSTPLRALLPAAQWDQLKQPLQFLQKPFHPDTFLSKARQILDHRAK